jgi:hypothetical protein
MKDYQVRQKFFFAVPHIFPKWDYPSRLAIGVKLSDALYRNAPYFKFIIKGETYQISRDKAFELGNKYVLAGGELPNLIPLEEFEVIKNEEDKLREFSIRCL